MREVNIRTADGDCRAFLFTPSGAGPWPAVIVFMDALGIRPVLFELCQRISDGGFLVLLPDMFYRAGPYEPRDAKAIFASGDVVAALAPLMSSTSDTFAARDGSYFLDFLGQLSDVRPGKVGVAGYCMGGATALMIAALYPDRVAMAASFHGGFLVTESDLSPHRLVHAITCPIYLGIAQDDPHFTPDEEQTLKRALDAAGVTYQIELFAGAPHGWTMSDLPIHVPAAAELHLVRLLSALYGAFDQPVHDCAETADP